MNGNGAQEQINTLIALQELQSAEPVSTSAAGHIYPQPEKETAGSFLEDVFKFATSLGVDTGELEWGKLPLYLIGAGLTVGSGGAGGLKKAGLKKTIPTVLQRTKQAESALSWLGRWVENPKTRERISKLGKSYDKKLDWEMEIFPYSHTSSQGFRPTTRERAVEMATNPKIAGFKETGEGVLGYYTPETKEIFLSNEWLKLTDKYYFPPEKFSSRLQGTAVHEGVHHLFYGRLPKEIHDKVLSSMDRLESSATRNLFARIGKKKVDYLKDPDELYPVIMGLRERIGVNPGEIISKNAFHAGGGSGIRHKMKNTTEYEWLSYLYKPETLRKLLNTIPALTAISLAGEQNK